MNNPNGAHERLAQLMQSRVSMARIMRHFPCELLKEEGKDEWHPLVAKKYGGSLWFHTCESSPERDHVFFAKIGDHDLRLLQDGVTVVIRNSLTEEVVQTYDLKEMEGFDLTAEHIEELLHAAFWQHGKKRTRTPRLPQGRRPHVRRTRRAERRRLRAAGRKN